MPQNAHTEQKERHTRIRRLKRFLRPLPRRATIHRYPILRHFAESARKRSYLWSFRRHYVVRAIYIGCILALLPVYGLQIILSFVLSIVTRSNLMIMCALQFITNPLTAFPLYLLCYRVGDFLLQPIMEPANKLSIHEMREQSETSFFEILKQAFENMSSASPGEMAHAIQYMLLSTTLGGVVLGYFTGFILSFIYQYIAHQFAQRKDYYSKEDQDPSANI